MSDLLNTTPGSIIRFSGPNPYAQQLSAVGNAAQHQRNGILTADHWRASASIVADQGERLIERIAFWREMPFAKRIVLSLVAELEAVTAEVEWKLNLTKRCN
jgi:predicted metal-dependent hydrolase